MDLDTAGVAMATKSPVNGESVAAMAKLLWAEVRNELRYQS